MTPAERDVSRARDIVRAELAAWRLSGSDALAKLEAAKGLAASPSVTRDLPASSDLKLVAVAYLLLRLGRELGVPHDSCGVYIDTGDLLRAVLAEDRAAAMAFPAGA